MYRIPGINEIIEVAAGLGIHLDITEATQYRRFVAKNLAARDSFLQARIEEEKPPLRSPSRAPGYRPDSTEDPLNAWIWKCRIEAETDGPLTGKTVSFKDQIAIAGIPMSVGSFALEGFRPDFDATVVTRVLDAGGTVVGHNVQDGLSGGFGWGSGVNDYGRPLNPHRPEHATGGSSTGSAVAVAVGEVDISFGGDQGGSVRIPSAWCGTVGLKPTFGLISHFGIGLGTEQSIDYVGPLARTVEDAAAALEVTAGYDGYDPRQGRDVPLSMAVTATLDRGVQGLKIGLLDEGFGEADPAVRDRVMAAADVLAQAGAIVSTVSVPEHISAQRVQGALMSEGLRALFQVGFYGAFNRTYYPASLIATINKLWAHQADLLRPRTKLALIEAEFTRRNYYGRVYAKAHNVRPHFIKAFDRALSEVDILLMPTCLTTAPRFTESASYDDAVEFGLQSPAEATRNTMTYDYTGHPALAVPVGKSNGLPVSMQLVGRFFDDPLLLRAAYAYQHSVDWDQIIAVERQAPAS
jgi:amidase